MSVDSKLSNIMILGFDNFEKIYFKKKELSSKYKDYFKKVDKKLASVNKSSFKELVLSKDFEAHVLDFSSHKSWFGKVFSDDEIKFIWNIKNNDFELSGLVSNQLALVSKYKSFIVSVRNKYKTLAYQSILLLGEAYYELLNKQLVALKNHDFDEYFSLVDSENNLNKECKDKVSGVDNKYLAKFKLKSFAVGFIILLSSLTVQTIEANAQERSHVLVENVENMNYNKFLRVNEYIVPGHIMQVYAESVSNRKLWSVPGGTAIHNPLLVGDAKQNFVDALRARYVSDAQIERYIELFNTRHNIILNYDWIQRGQFEMILEHERRHVEIHKLSSRELRILGRGVQRLLQRIDELTSVSGASGGFSHYLMVSRHNWTEAIAHMPEDIAVFNPVPPSKNVFDSNIDIYLDILRSLELIGDDEIIDYEHFLKYYPERFTAEDILKQVDRRAFRIYLRIKERSKIK